MALYRAEGIVLRTRPLGEADTVLTFYTREVGKRRAVARGARRPRSRLRGLVQPFSHCRFLVFEGKSLDSVSQGELINSFARVRDDLVLMASASYIAELIDQLVEENEPAEQLFDLVLNTFAALISQESTSMVLRFFELNAMAQLGYMPHLHACIECEGFLKEPVHFSIEGGGALCGQCRAADPNAIPTSLATLQVMKRLLDWDLDRIGIIKPSEQTLTELARILRLYVDYRLPGQLKSLEFLQSLQIT